MRWASSPLLQTNNPTGIHHSLTSTKKCGEKRTLERWPYHVNVAFPASKQGRWKYITQNAVPDVAAAAITVMVVGAAVTSLARMNKSTTIEPKQKICEVCNGSGICGECNGEGFILKNLSEAAVAKARQNAKTAATRYTAGLAKKWNYCPKCSGSRGCLVCDGRGTIK